MHRFESRQRRLRSGFSFAEVMFAVVILGIGFVMLSAIFPVAIEQTRNTADQAVAAQLARDAFKSITSATRAEDYPNNGGITQAFADVIPLWNQISGTTICPTDSRYAWVPFFSKSPIDGTVRITVLVVRRWSHDNYSPTDIGGDGALIPRGVKITGITRQPDGSDQVQITKDSIGSYNSLVNGAFLIMRSGDGDVVGRTFRLGQQTAESTDSVYWTLQPQDALLPGETCTGGSAAVIGRDFIDPANPQSGFTGPAQDIAVYTSFIQPR